MLVEDVLHQAEYQPSSSKAHGLNLEVAERIDVELHLMRRSMEAVVKLLSNFRL